MLKTRLTEMFGMEHPIMQGGMQRVSTAELVFRRIAKAEQIIGDRLSGIASGE